MNGRMTNRLRFACSILATVGFVALAVLVGYCWQNKSGHSAMDPQWVTFAIFFPLFLIGVIVRWRRPEAKRVANLLSAVGLAGFLFGTFVVGLGILPQYEKWIRNGMPERNPHTELLLSGYLVGALLLTWMADRRIRSATDADP